MNIIRFILLILMVWILWQFYQRWHKIKKQQKDNNSALPSKIMVSCHHCNLYLPEEEAFCDGDLYFCCKKHLLANKSANKSANK
ncbi:MAG: hypothetical protein KAH84_03140 [Thiomargarita sp.]|nr:hypothetical protein [Thiomargarita sp.]